MARFDQLRREQAGRTLDGGYRYIKLARMAYYVNKEAYLQRLQQHITELERDLPAATGPTLAVSP